MAAIIAVLLSALLTSAYAVFLRGLPANLFLTIQFVFLFGSIPVFLIAVPVYSYFSTSKNTAALTAILVTLFPVVFLLLFEDNPDYGMFYLGYGLFVATVTHILVQFYLKRLRQQEKN